MPAPAAAPAAKPPQPPKPSPGKGAVAGAPAAAAPPPASGAKKTGDPLLDAADVDAAFERELSATKPKRSVYVPPAAGSDLPDKLTEAQIQEGVASRIDQLRQCLEQQNAARPDSHGTLKMRWSIQADGSVTGVKPATPELAGQPIATCIGGVLQTVRFPRTRSGVPEVVFPFRF
jgi:hypothetical protein